MREKRAALARDLGLDPGVLCSSRLLKDAVRGDPDDAEALATAAGLRPWQRELLGEALWAAYRGRAAAPTASSPVAPPVAPAVTPAVSSGD